MKKLLLVAASLLFVMNFAMAQEMKTQGNKKQEKKVKETPEETVVVEEGDDEFGHYILETTTEKTAVVSSGLWKSWNLVGGVGAQFYLGDNDWKAKFKDWWTGPAVDLYLNKWITPVFGLGLGFTYNPFLGLYQQKDDVAAFRTDEFYSIYNGYQHLYRQKGHTFNPYIIAMLDLDNLFGGYKPQRVYNVALYAGGGVIFGTDPIQTRCGATFNLGLLNYFRVWKYLDLVLNIRGGLVSDHFDGESRLNEPQTSEYIKNNFPFDGTLGATFGLVFHFGKKKTEWVSTSNVKKTYTTSAASQQEIERLQKELAAAQNSKQETVVVSKEPANLWYHVQFQIDKWNISNRELVNLESIAELIKSAPDVMFSICGYADVQTATPKHNLMLSRHRVEEVFNVLTEKFGVNPKQLSCDYKGGVDLMFLGDNELSRCVIIKTAEGKPFEQK